MDVSGIKEILLWKLSWERLFWNQIKSNLSTNFQN